jgi:hypothetical protein
MIRRPPTLVEDYDHICRDDPAFDSEASGYDELYEKCLEDGNWDRLPRKNGEDPTIWRLRHLRGMAKRKLADYLVEANRTGLNAAVVAYAAKMGVISCKNFPDDRGDEFSVESTVDRESKITCLTDRCLEYLDEVPGLINDLGIRVIREATLQKKS